MNPHSLKRDLALTLALLALLLVWEASRWDLAVAAWYGGADGFGLRDAWLTRDLLHDGGRKLGWAVLALLALAATAAPADERRERWVWLGLVLACLVAVPAIKQFSTTSCPWDLSQFGGQVPYLPHWPWLRSDGGPGHCFPSGHAVAAFAFLPLYFQWRGRRPRTARALLAAVLAAGALFGWAQLARGAHFPSHTLWSLWLCWTLGVAGAAFARRRGTRREPAFSPASPALAPSRSN